MHAVPFGASLVINYDPRCHFNDRNMSIVTPTSLLSTVVRHRLILLFFSSEVLVSRMSNLKNETRQAPKSPASLQKLLQTCLNLDCCY
jgi:hypothetical protein